MAVSPNISVLLPQDGVQAADQNYYTQIPNQTTAGLKIVKRPGTGVWNALTQLSGVQGLGYLKVREDDSGTRFRMLLTDDPDGP